jgi:GT2 family glycosyltransferase
VLEHLADTLGDAAVGVAGPMLVNPDGSLQPSCAAHPSIRVALLVGAGLHRLLPDRVLARLAPQFWSHDRAIDTGWLMGAALAVRADFFHELGGFWPLMYGEDEDLAYRAQQRGLRVRFDRSVRVMHLGNHSAAQRWSSAERAERVAAAELEFLRAHASRTHAATIRAIVGAAYAARWLAHSLLGRRRQAAIYRAMARVYTSGRLVR